MINNIKIDGRVNFVKNFEKLQSFSLSQSHSKKNKETNEWEVAGYTNLDIKNFNMDNLVKDGDIIEIEGRFDINNEYTDKNGSKISKPVIIATSIKKIEPAKKENISSLEDNSPTKEKSDEFDLSEIPF